MLINKILSAYTPSKIIMSAWSQRSAHLSKILSIKPQKSCPKQDADHIIWRYSYQAGAFMLYIYKY
jgi:hypothetical protein